MAEEKEVTLYRVFWNDYEEDTIAICDSPELAWQMVDDIVNAHWTGEAIRRDLSVDEYPLNKIPEWSSWK